MARPRITQRHFIGWVSVPRRTALPASPGPRAPAGSRRGREAGRALGIFGGPRFALILVPVMPGQLSRSFAPPKTRVTELARAGLCPSRNRLGRLSRSFALPEICATELGRARLCPGRNRLGRLSRSFALPRIARPNSGGRGSVRAAIASAGSAGASPSQKYAQATRTREGEDPSEPQSPRPAQRELRPPRNSATELGRARLCPGRNRLGRLSGSFALPEYARPNSGGRGSVRAAIASAGSAGASPSQKYAQRDRTREGEAPSEPRSPRPAQQETRPTTLHIFGNT